MTPPPPGLIGLIKQSYVDSHFSDFQFSMAVENYDSKKKTFSNQDS